MNEDTTYLATSTHSSPLTPSLQPALKDPLAFFQHLSGMDECELTLGLVAA